MCIVLLRPRPPHSVRASKTRWVRKRPASPFNSISSFLLRRNMMNQFPSSWMLTKNVITRTQKWIHFVAKEQQTPSAWPSHHLFIDAYSFAMTAYTDLCACARVCVCARTSLSPFQSWMALRETQRICTHAMRLYTHYSPHMFLSSSPLVLYVFFVLFSVLLPNEHLYCYLLCCAWRGAAPRRAARRHRCRCCCRGQCCFALKWSRTLWNLIILLAKEMASYFPWPYKRKL